jgi:hypothetical protein
MNEDMVIGVRVDCKLIGRLKKEHPEWEKLDAVEIVDVALRSYLRGEKTQ